ncbi:ATP-binding protein [Actinacidiphila oryziradicis]|uniref:ATP-binding protein n=1 Tax=Actinacidiphila oryziradicis TaxID=2571141 RepID=UPI0023F31318|nr:ATP-binding protein [Actinacidiphila oryziradicis]MCW2874231.1 ATP-binding protein [Actinacidiphila oryziradicis]
MNTSPPHPMATLTGVLPRQPGPEPAAVTPTPTLTPAVTSPGTAGPASVIRVELAAEYTAPARARRHTRAALSSWDADQDAVDSAELAVTELVTNAVVHTGTTENVVLTLRRTKSRLRIEVWDHDDRPPVPRCSSPGSTNGRGLAVVAAVADRWSWSPAPAGGKVVWCELSLGCPLGCP